VNPAEVCPEKKLRVIPQPHTVLRPDNRIVPVTPEPVGHPVTSRPSRFSAPLYHYTEQATAPG